LNTIGSLACKAASQVDQFQNNSHKHHKEHAELLTSIGVQKGTRSYSTEVETTPPRSPNTHGQNGGENSYATEYKKAVSIYHFLMISICLLPHYSDFPQTSGASLVAPESISRDAGCEGGVHQTFQTRAIW